MIKTFNYLKSLFKHKYYTMKACFKLGLYYQGIIHDFSKFSPSEFFKYVNKFGKNIKKGRDKSGYYDPTKDLEFISAWLHHVHNNKHHWQYWILVEKNSISTFEIPLKYILEMFCDWHGANKAYGGNGHIIDFFEKNNMNMSLHDNTRKWIVKNIYYYDSILNRDNKFKHL